MNFKKTVGACSFVLCSYEKESANATRDSNQLASGINQEHPQSNRVRRIGQTMCVINDVSIVKESAGKGGLQTGDGRKCQESYGNKYTCYTNAVKIF